MMIVICTQVQVLSRNFSIIIRKFRQSRLHGPFFSEGYERRISEIESDGKPIHIVDNMSDQFWSEEYQAFLKNKLDLACKAVALTRANRVAQQQSPTTAPLIVPPIVQIDNHTAATVLGNDLPKKKDNDVWGIYCTFVICSAEETKCPGKVDNKLVIWRPVRRGKNYISN